MTAFGGNNRYSVATSCSSQIPNLIIEVKKERRDLGVSYRNEEEIHGEKICIANFPKGKQSSGLFIGEGRTGENPVKTKQYLARV